MIQTLHSMTSVNTNIVTKNSKGEIVRHKPKKKESGCITKKGTAVVIHENMMFVGGKQVLCTCPVCYKFCFESDDPCPCNRCGNCFREDCYQACECVFSSDEELEEPTDEEVISIMNAHLRSLLLPKTPINNKDRIQLYPNETKIKWNAKDFSKETCFFCGGGNVWGWKIGIEDNVCIPCKEIWEYVDDSDFLSTPKDYYIRKK